MRNINKLGDSGDWGTRADEAYQEFIDTNSDQRTNAEIWSGIALRYDLPDTLNDFFREKKRRIETTVDVSLGAEIVNESWSRACIRKNPNDFFRLKKAWTEFYYKYQGHTKEGGDVLWSVFCGVRDPKTVNGLEKLRITRALGKGAVSKIVGKFGLSNYDDYLDIVKDSQFLLQLQTKQRVFKIFKRKG